METTYHSTDRNLLTYQDAADLLGIKPQSLRRWVSERRVPFIKIGRVVRFDAHELQLWIKYHSVQPDGGHR